MILENQVAVVTGSTKGIGRAIAARLADAGAAVVVSGRSRGPGEEFVSVLRDAGHQAVYCMADITREEDIHALMTKAVVTFGRLTVLVNNAAPTEHVAGANAIDGTVRRVATQQWRTIIESILTSVFWGCKYAMPLIASGGGGAITNISSVTSIQPMRGVAAYSAAKGGVNAFTRALAFEGAGDGVRCNALVVGMIPTGDTARSDETSTVGEPWQARWKQSIESSAWREALTSFQLTDLGKADDIANLVAFLSSEQARSFTGLILPSDGGSTIKSALPAALLRGSVVPGIFLD